jgi:hypothetical protein
MQISMTTTTDMIAMNIFVLRDLFFNFNILSSHAGALFCDRSPQIISRCDAITGRLQPSRGKIILCEKTCIDKIFRSFSPQPCGKENVLSHSLPWKEAIILKNERNIFSRSLKRLPLKQNLSLPGFQKPAQELKQRGLSCTGLTQDRDTFTSADLQVQIVQDIPVRLLRLREGDFPRLDNDVFRQIFHCATISS